MNQDKDYTVVVFLEDTDKSGIFAYFPELDEGENRKRCYAHIGQHSVCHIDYAKECKVVKDPERYYPLLCELRDMTYKPSVKFKL